MKESFRLRQSLPLYTEGRQALGRGVPEELLRIRIGRRKTEQRGGIDCEKVQSQRNQRTVCSKLPVRSLLLFLLSLLFTCTILFRYVECFMHCQKPMLESKCGNKVLDLEMNSIGVTFRNLDEMMSESSAAGYWPRECKPLSSMGLHPEKPSSPAANVSTHENSTAIADVQVAGASAPSNATAPSRTVPPVATATPLAKVTSPAATELNSTIVVATVKPVSPRPGNTTARARSRAVRKN